MSIISRIFGGAHGPTKLNAVSVNQSCQGLPLPVVLGKHKIQQSVLWLNGFKVHEVSGGKGGGKGAGFEYSADTVIALCEGPITAVDDVWYNQTWLSNIKGAENTTVPAAGIYTPTGAQTAATDGGVSVINAASITTQDLGAPTTTVISGATFSPMYKVDYGNPLSAGQYSVNTSAVGGSPFVLSSVDNHIGSTTKYHGTIGSPGASNGLAGYTLIIAGFSNAVNNSGTGSPATGFICTASDTTSITLANAFGVSETKAATATEPGNTYHFSSYDSANATPIQVNYSYKLNFVRAQEVTGVPASKTIFVGAPYANGVDEGVMYYNSGLPNFGTLLTSVATNPPTVTGTYHFISSGSGQLGSTYIFAAGDINAEVLVTYQYQNNSLIPKDAPSTLNFTMFNGAQGQSVWSLLSSTFPGEALNYTSTAYVGYNPMELAGSADIPNVTYEVQTKDGYGGGIIDCNPIQCILRVLTDPVWGLGSGVTTFPIAALDIGPTGTWGVPPIIGPAVPSATPNTITTGPVTVKVHASSGNGWQGLGGALLSTTVVNTPVFNQVLPNYPINGFALTTGGGSILGIPLQSGTMGGYKLNPMVAVETTGNSTLLDTKTLTGTTGTFTMDMTGTFTVPAAGTYTFFVNYANYGDWAFYCQGATRISGTTPPSSNNICTSGLGGSPGPPFPSVGPTTGYGILAAQSANDGSHPTPATIVVTFAAGGTYGWEAVYNQDSSISSGGEANGYFQITTQNGTGLVNSSNSNLGVTILPTVNISTGSVPTGTTAYNWFAANGYFISANLDKQDSASSVIGKWLEAGMCAGFMSEGLFKLVPFGDTSTMGNGCIWLAPAAYIVALDDSCFLSKDGEEPVKISRSAWQDGYNYCQVKWANRVAQYADEVTPEFDQAAIDRFGLRMEEAQDYNFICNLTSATFSANMRVKRSVNIRNTYAFKLPFTYSYLEPMDIVTISTTSLWAQALTADAQLNVVSLPVRIIKTVDDPVEGISITAEDYPYGVGQPVLYNKAINTATPAVDLYADPGNTEVVAFEPTGRQTANYSGNQIWIGAVGQSREWGGCNVWVSSDGVKYLQVGEITEPGRIGELASPFASGSDPDINNVLVVDLVENSPALDAGTTNDADQGNTLCYVNGEVIAYSDVTLTDAGQFTMSLQAPSVPGYIRRGLLGTTIASHDTGSLFMRLDTTVFKYTYDPVWYGKTIYFKFQSFNRFKNSAQDLANLTAVAFNIAGKGGAVDASSGLVLETPIKIKPVGVPIPPKIGVGWLGWRRAHAPAILLEDNSNLLLLEDAYSFLDLE